MAKRTGAPTIRDVARKADVSVGTASRVINGEASVKQAVRARVLAAIQELDYRPNAVAQSMRRRSTKMVGCIIREINIPSLAAFVRAAQGVLDEAGHSLLLSNSHGLASRERKLLDRLESQKTEGVLFGPYTKMDETFDAFLRGLSAALVLVDRDQPDWTDCVMADHAGAMEAATTHLLELGHRRILLMTGAGDIYPARERIAGYKRAFEKKGLPSPEDMIRSTGFSASEGFDEVTRALTQEARPTAVIAGGIDMLPGVLRAIRHLGLSIPAEVSVLDTGDSELAQLHKPPISTVRWDQGAIGRIAAQLLLNRIENPRMETPQRVLIPVEYIPRQSFAPPRLYTDATSRSRPEVL